MWLSVLPIESGMTKQSTKQDTLVPLETYLASGIHIGTARKLKEMSKFIFKVRPDGLSVLDIATVDRKLKEVAKFLSKYSPEKVMVVSGSDSGKKAILKLAEFTGVNSVATRFMPGSLTNPQSGNYTEPEVLLVTDPGLDKQALSEALHMNLPIVALCGTSNSTQNIDVVLPVNNKGKKSLALIFWILTRELLKEQGKIKKDAEFTAKVEDFESDIKEEKPRQPRREGFQRREGRFRRNY